MHGFLGFIGLGLVFSTAFGILHDLYSVWVCEPYLRDFHPHTGLTGVSLALFWGFVATWFVGVFAGLTLAIVATAGKRPKLGARHAVKPLLIGTAILLALAPLVWNISIRLCWSYPSIVPREFFMFGEDLVYPMAATGMMHSLSYLGAIVMTAIVCVMLHGRRKRLCPE